MNEIVYDAEGNAFELVPGRTATLAPSFGGASLRQALSRAASLRGVLDDPANREALARALVQIGACTSGEAVGMSRHEVRERAQDAFDAGALRLVPFVQQLRPICDVYAAPADRLADELPPVQPMQATHTLELELVDEDDEPVPGEDYRVELPNGDVIRGRLNAQGKALLTGIEDSGSCKVTFPRLDEAVWEAM